MTVSILREEPNPASDTAQMDLAAWSSGLGLVAGITAGAGDGIDFGLASISPAGEVVSRWLSLGASMRPRFDGLVVSRQVHGTRVHVQDEHLSGWLVLEGFDGHTTRHPGILLAITVADCVPIYMAAPSRRAVSLLHAGWRGVAGGMLEAGLEGLRQVVGAEASEVVVHLGVGICGNCYEVGPDTLAALGVESGPTVDLRDLLAAQARAAGVKIVTRSPWCARHDRQFHSHRRDSEGAGRMVAYLGMPLT